MELISITEDTKYRDPLHQLLDHVAEVSNTCLASYHSRTFMPNANMTYVADT